MIAAVAIMFIAQFGHDGLWVGIRVPIRLERDLATLLTDPDKTMRDIASR
jgi:hypothetical protein